LIEPVSPTCTEDGLPDPAPMTEEHLAQIAKALGHPARIRILELFDECIPHLAGEIVENCALAQSTVSEHLRILREADILFARTDGPRTWYCVRRSVLHAFARAMEDLAVEPVLHHHTR
jgi:ArsR family transcriptional regulator